MHFDISFQYLSPAPLLAGSQLSSYSLAFNHQDEQEDLHEDVRMTGWRYEDEFEGDKLTILSSRSSLLALASWGWFWQGSVWTCEWWWGWQVHHLLIKIIIGSSSKLRMILRRNWMKIWRWLWWWKLFTILSSRSSLVPPASWGWASRRLFSVVRILYSWSTSSIG